MRERAHFFGGSVPFTKDERDELIAKYLPTGWSLAEELALLALQPGAKQEIVEERLKAIDRYLDPTSDVAGNGDIAAAALGVGRRQLLNLVTKVRSLGPTRALSPGFRNVARRSVARAGLDRRAEGYLRQILEIDPSMRLSKIETSLRFVCDAQGIPLPGRSSIRKRVLSLRAKPWGGEDLGVFGAHLTVDQVNLDLPVRDGTADRYAIITLIIDQQTKLIAGHGVMAGYDNGEGLQLALDDFRVRVATFANARLSVADHVRKVTWIVPKNLDIFSEVFGVRIGPTGPEVDLVDSGQRRHGAAILRTIGDRLPPFSFKPMAMERFEAVSEQPGIQMSEARELLRVSVDRWNSDILADHRENVGERIGRSGQLQRIVRVVGDIVEPIVREAQDAMEMFDDDASE